MTPGGWWYNHLKALARRLPQAIMTPEYYQAHREELLAKSRLRYQRNREALKAQAALYRQTNKMTVNERQRAAYARDPAKYRRSEMKRKYGLSQSDYDALLSAQDGACAICLQVPSVFHVDHDHKTMVVRGLLCANCNHALGKLKDSPERAERAAAYLRKCHG